MNDREMLIRLYEDLEAALIRKDTGKLRGVLDDSFVLTHMTGMRQSREEYLESVRDGTMNSYSSEHDEILVTYLTDSAAQLRGRSRTNAAVFGGGRHTWRLQLDFRAEKKGEKWKFVSADASTY